MPLLQESNAQKLKSTIKALSKNSRTGKRSDPTVVIAECLSQHIPGVLAQRGRGHRIRDRGQAQTNRRFDIRDRTRGRVRDLANTMALTHLRRIEGLLDGTEKADGD